MASPRSYPFQQNNNLLYLTGFAEPDAVLAVEKDGRGEAQFRMFVEDNDSHTLLWSGPRNGIQGTRAHFGLESVWKMVARREP